MMPPDYEPPPVNDPERMTLWQVFVCVVGCIFAGMFGAMVAHWYYLYFLK